MTRPLKSALALLLLALLLPLIGFSAATLTAHSSNAQTVSGQQISNWMGAYSQSTDPDGLSGYAAGGSGSNLTLAYASSLSLSELALGASRNRAWTVKAVSAFPEPVTPITVSLTVLDDDPKGSTNLSAKINAIGSGGGSASRSLAAGQKAQINLSVPALSGLLSTGKTYTPHVRMTVTFTGNSTGFLVYTVPVSLTL